VRGHYSPLDAVLMGYGGHLQALLPGFWPVINIGEQMAMEVNHTKRVYTILI